jgi:ribonuclease J
VASIEFWGGLAVIGSSKILIRDGDSRVLLDIGLDIPGGADLFRVPVRERPGRELADRLRVDAAPALPGIYDPAMLDPDDPLGKADGETGIFVSHPHIDHVGLAGFVRPDIPVHAHTDAVDMLNALASAGDGLKGGDPEWHRLTDGQVVRIGAVEVECVPVDHDVPGACGYLVRTSSGTLAYTGDIRFHGRQPDLSWNFVARAAGCDALVTEASTVSFALPDEPFRNEDDVLESFADILESSPGLVLMSTYPRDVERVAEFVEAAQRLGRTIVWPRNVAQMLRLVGVPSAVTWGEGAERSEVHANPRAFAVQPDPADLPSLLDLPIEPGVIFAHANGEPLGDFDPRWAPFVDWLDTLGVELRKIGCWGHASPEHLHEMIERIAPRVVFPIHTFEPTRIYPPRGVRRVVPVKGRSYAFDGSLTD